MNDLPGVRGYQSYPLTGTPVGRLYDDTARMLASGGVPRCPHPDQPAFWFLPARKLTCASCVSEFVEDIHTVAACHVCGKPASAVAAWVAGGVPCVAGLCENCHSSGLVPLATN